MKDRRKFFRWPSSLTCLCEGEGIEVRGRIVDLSHGGACVAEPTALPEEGVDIKVTIDPDGQAIQLRAHVVFNNPVYELAPDEFGLEFYEQPEERSKKLMPLFKEYLEQEE